MRVRWGHAGTVAVLAILVGGPVEWAVRVTPLGRGTETALLALLVAAVLLRRPAGIPEKLFRAVRPLAPLMVGFAVLAAMPLLGAWHRSGHCAPADLKRLLTTVTAAAAIVLAAILARESAVARQLRLVALFGFALALTAILVDAWLPGTFSAKSLRAAGFPTNPNAGAVQLVALTAATAAWRGLRAWPTPLVLALAAIGLWPTASRTGWFLLALLVVFHPLGRRATVQDPQPRSRRQRVLRWAIATFLLALALTVVIFGDFAQRPRFRDRISNAWRVEQVLTDVSVRAGFTAKAFELFVQSPWVGSGAARVDALERGGHNAYIQFAALGGVPALAALLSILAWLAWQFWRNGNRTGLFLLAILLFAGMTSHTVFDRCGLAILLGLCIGRIRPRASARAAGSGQRSVET